MPFFLYPSVKAECNFIWYGISLWQICVSCPSVPSQLLSDPQLTLCGGIGVQNGKGETTDAVQTLFSNSQNTGVLSVLF